MPEPTNPTPITPGFLDDFYAECDEYLTNIRGALLRLEDKDGEGEAELWQLLFRQMHSLKGVMGMAGLEGPERLAHATESYLRALTKQPTPLNEQHLDALSGVTQHLEQVLVAHRQQQPLPDLAPMIERMNRLAQAPEKPSSSGGGKVTPGEVPKHAAAVDQAVKAGKKVWRCRFLPSSDLHQRGIDVNSVRQRLRGLGEIVYSAPQVQPNGAIAFEFLVATREDVQMAGLSDGDALTIEPVEPSATGLDQTSASSASAGAAPPSVASSPAYVAPSHIVRVDLSRLDELVRSMGELVVFRARLEAAIGRVGGELPVAEARALQEINYSFAKELRRLRDGLMRLRLVPLAEVFERMSLVVRDLARESGRQIQLVVKGQETQIDKYVVERLKDPLLHLVRNAVTHGLGPLAERTARGKPDALSITLEAATVGESVVIQVSDDGVGIQTEKVRQQAIKAGVTVPEPLTPAALLDILCTPGFSTKEEADLGAGRGVGMAVVKDTVIELGGELSVASEPGRGTSFTLRLPLTLAIADALLILAGGQQFAVPHIGLHEVVTVELTAIHRLERAEYVRYREGILPLVRLAQIFHLPEARQAEHPMLVLGHGVERVGVLVDGVLGQREIMVRALSDPLFKVPAVSGATDLGDGRAVLILDVGGLVQMARTRHTARVAA